MDAYIGAAAHEYTFQNTRIDIVSSGIFFESMELHIATWIITRYGVKSFEGESVFKIERDINFGNTMNEYVTKYVENEGRVSDQDQGDCIIQ